MRGRGKSPSESLTRPLSGMRGPLPGTGVGARSGSTSGALAVGGRREARGAGVLTERSAAERASTRRPEESLSAWDRERPRTRGATGAPAPQRPSRGRRAGEGPPAPATGTCSNRGSKTRARRGAQRTEGSGRDRQRVRKRNRQRSGPGHIYTYIPITHTSVLPPLTPSGGKDASVCVRGRARVCQPPAPNASAKR